VAMRPGKPLIFGKLGKTPLLGLPGNPVSSFVCAMLFLKPAIAAMLGAGEATPVVGVEVRYRAPLGLDDHLRLGLSAQRIGNTSFTTRCDVWGPRAEHPAVEVVVTHAFGGYTPPRPGQGAAVTKQALPPWLRKALAAGSDSEGSEDMGGERCAQN